MEGKEEPILSFRKVSKIFPGTNALQDVSFDIYPGEIHCIAGENGAGKSTLIKIISGVQKQTSGEILFHGKEINWMDPGDAVKHGIVTIFQELSIIPNISVAENILFGREFLNGPFIAQRQMYKKAKEYLKIFDLKVDPSKPAGNYSIAIRQLIEITRAVSRNAEVIIMDEPTSSLSEGEVDRLLDIMISLKKSGITIIFVSHKIEELLAIGDRISILRDGHYITTLPREESSKEKIVTAMVGRKLDQYYTKSQHTAGKEILRVENLSGQGFKNVSFSLKQGEILGFFGLIGAGRTELMETIFGYRPLNDGKIYFNGELLKIKNPSNLIEKGVGFIPEDRKLKGLSLIHSIKMNLEFLNLDIVKGSSGLFVSTKKERDFAQKAVDALKIKTSSLDKLVSLLSGGNQQKIVIAKWLPRNPKVLILDEPTRGIDVLTKAEIYKLIDELALNGIGIIMVSSELPEILQMSDRIAVMSDGNLVDILINGPDVNQEKIMHLSTSISTSKESLLKQNQNLIKR